MSQPFKLQCQNIQSILYYRAPSNHLGEPKVSHVFVKHPLYCVLCTGVFEAGQPPLHGTLNHWGRTEHTTFRLENLHSYPLG